MTSGQGRIAGLQRSAGGVPKLPVEQAAVGPAGMEGDEQRDRRFHGGPDRALCLYSQERIDALFAEGHDISPGALGENVTIAGLSWDVVRPGVRLRLGGVDVEVTGFASPCSKLAGAFLDAAFTRVGQKVNPGWSRVYVRVLSEGALAVGDPVVLLP
ncbi:MAG TPA: MOSC domain-containing protein [Gemmatimonadaceae bacterium]